MAGPTMVLQTSGNPKLIDGLDVLANIMLSHVYTFGVEL
jgi:hypothetical protein